MNEIHKGKCPEGKNIQWRFDDKYGICITEHITPTTTKTKFPSPPTPRKSRHRCPNDLDVSQILGYDRF